MSSFLLPDAPPRKKTRLESPERIPCPLKPGTPTTPPPRIPQAWELKRKVSKSPVAGPSRYVEPEDVATGYGSDQEKDYGCDEGPITIPESSGVRCSPLTPSTGCEIPVEKIHGLAIVNAEIELEGFSPGPVPSVAAPGGPVAGELFSAPEPGHIIFFDEVEVQGLINPGSDIEEDVDENVESSTLHREMYPEYENMEELDTQDDQALRLLASEDMLHFDWSSDPNIFTGQKEDFLGQPGPTFGVSGLSPFQILEKIWNEEIMSLICSETNRYAEDIKNQPGQAVHARIKKWVPLTISELWTFFGVLMIHSIVPLPVEKEYWVPRFKYLKFGNVGDFMTLERFQSIKRCLHFVDNLALSFLKGTPDRLRKIAPIVEHLNERFSSLYVPEQHITIDESLLLWKGRLSFAQLINTKAARVGIKSYELCESKSGYLWKMTLYAGKQTQNVVKEEDTQDEPEGATSKIVYNLVRPLLHKGHVLVMDNFYNSPLLSRTLKNKKTDTMGTLRLNREFVPESLRRRNKSNMRTGEVCYSQTHDLSILVWKDSNVVSLISTFHKPEVGGKEKFGQYRYKPQVVLDYNLSMGGVDKKDQLLQAFPVERVRNLVWYKKLFRRLLNVSILNAHVIHSSAYTMTSRNFRGLLADEILGKFRPIALTRPAPAQFHFPEKTGKRKSRCKLCAESKKDVCTVWKCGNCNVNLCLPECFKIYHLTR